MPDDLPWYMSYGAFIFAGLMMLLGLAMMFWPTKSVGRGGGQIGDSYHVGRDNFGHVGPVNNYGRPKFGKEPELIRYLVSHLDGDKPVHLLIVGDKQARDVGEYYAKELERSGLTVTVSTVGAIAPTPSKPVTIDDRGELYRVVIAPNA